MKFVMSVFRKSVEKIKVSLKSDKNSGYFTWTQIYICSSMTFSWKSFRLWDNVENFCRAGQDKDDNIIGRMRISRWVSKATNTHFRNIIRSFVFPLRQWLHEPAWMSRTLPLLFSLLETFQAAASAHTFSYLMSAGSSFPGGKGTRTGSKTLHLHLVLG